jgi:hypothetical protein
LPNSTRKRKLSIFIDLAVTNEARTLVSDPGV